MTFQADTPVASLYIESGIWGAMWHRIAQGVQVLSPDSDMPVHDIELTGGPPADGEQALAKFISPEWSLISPQGLMASLQMAVTVFTKVSAFWLPFGNPQYYILYYSIFLLASCKKFYLSASVVMIIQSRYHSPVIFVFPLGNVFDLEL